MHLALNASLFPADVANRDAFAGRATVHFRAAQVLSQINRIQPFSIPASFEHAPHAPDPRHLSDDNERGSAPFRRGKCQFIVAAFDETAMPHF
ncbi:hypothetical protein [Bradyrhizobium cenepequi]